MVEKNKYTHSNPGRNKITFVQDKYHLFVGLFFFDVVKNAVANGS